MKKKSVFISILTFVFLTLLVSGSLSFAADFDCSNYASIAAEPGESSANSVLYLVCPLKGAINLGLIFVGGMLIVFILYGAIKAVQAQGDPKMLEGAKQTWTWAIFGALIILVAITGVTIIYRILGSPLGPLDILGKLNSALQSLYDSF